MADRLDDLICTSHPGASAMETLAILLLGWIIFGTILTIIGRFVYSKLLLDVPKDSLLDPPPPGTAGTAGTAAPAPPSGENAAEKVTNTERFINTLKSNPPPAPPKLLQRSKSGSVRSVHSFDASQQQQQQHQHVLVPIVTGSNADCVKWVTNCLHFVYSRNQLWSDLIATWKESLNALTKRSEIETGVSVEIQQLVFQEELPPRMLNVFCEISSSDRAAITGDFESRFALLVRARREQRDHQTISDYRLQVERLRGRINVMADHRDCTGVIKFDGWPEVKITAMKDDLPSSQEVATPAANTSSDEQLLLDIILEMVTSALRSGTNHLNWSRYPDFPRYVASHQQAEPVLPVHYDSMLQSRAPKAMRDKKLLVKVIRANGLSPLKGMTAGDMQEVYAIIEMDDPPQRHQTAPKKGTENPFWDENYVFDVGATTEEIMFEVYSRGSGRNTVFLGLGIVGMEELPLGHSQKQVITLQSRPYENDPVSGTLTVEFLFVDSAEEANQLMASMGAANHKAQLKSGNQFLESLPKEPPVLPMRKSHILRGAIPRDFEAVDPLDKRDSFYATDGDFSLHSGTGSVGSSLAGKEEEGERVRGGRARKRNFFRSIKDRLSRSKKRSRSVDPGAPRDDSLSCDESLLRSVSVDRARASQLLEVPGMVSSEMDSTRSSLSEVSVISTASTSRTFLDEASTLVLETLENDIKKHYLIPMAMAEKRKWKKKGTKLHIFSDHVFVARHLPGGSPCQVCQQTLPRRLVGKQGYECRDCLLRCHKPCHVKVDTLCPNSSVPYMELEFVEGVDEATGKARNGII